MATTEFPNEWESLTKEQVMEWLDSPCTMLMKKEIANGLVGYDELAVELVNSPYQFTDQDYRAKSEQIRIGKLALKQADDLIGKAEEYVKG